MLRRNIITLAVLTILFSGCAKSALPDNQDQNNNVNVSPEEVIDQETLTQNYEKSVKEAMAEFWQTNQAAEAREAILDLKTPSQYLDLHLKLVISLDEIEQGQFSGDQTKIDSGLEKINELASQYSFIK